MSKPFATKDEFISFIADEQNIKKNEANTIIDIFTKSVIEAIKQGKEIYLRGFGVFTISNMPARDGINPRTGAALKIAAYKTPRFKAGKKLKKSCN